MMSVVESLLDFKKVRKFQELAGIKECKFDDPRGEDAIVRWPKFYRKILVDVFLANNIRIESENRIRRNFELRSHGFTIFS